MIRRERGFGKPLPRDPRVTPAVPAPRPGVPHSIALPAPLPRPFSLRTHWSR